MKVILTTTLALLMTTTTGMAGSVINKDSTSYDIAVNCGGGTSRTSISGGTTKSGYLNSSASKCEVEVKGVGEIEVSGSDDVVIKDGSLEKK